MHTTLLQELGLPLNEAKIYEALLTYGGSSVSTVSLRSGVHRRNTYDGLHRLIEKGLVYEVFSQGETVYEAVEPGKLMEFVKEQERSLELAMPDLVALHDAERIPQKASIYKGPNGVKDYLRLILKEQKDVYSFGAKGAWFDPRIIGFTRRFLEDAKQKNIRFHHIFDADIHALKADVPHAVGKPYKVLPKEFTTTSCIDIFGDYIVTYTGLYLGKLSDDLTLFVMRSPRLAKSYRKWFQMIWDLLPTP